MAPHVGCVKRMVRPNVTENNADQTWKHLSVPSHARRSKKQGSRSRWRKKSPCTRKGNHFLSAVATLKGSSRPSCRTICGNRSQRVVDRDAYAGSDTRLGLSNHALPSQLNRRCRTSYPVNGVLAADILALFCKKKSTTCVPLLFKR